MESDTGRNSAEGDETASAKHEIRGFPRTGREWRRCAVRGSLRSFDYGCEMLAHDGMLAIVLLDDGRQLYIHLSEFRERKDEKSPAGPKATKGKPSATKGGSKRKPSRSDIVFATLDALSAKLGGNVSDLKQNIFGFAEGGDANTTQ